MPVFILLGTKDLDAAIVAGRVIGDRRGKGDVEPRRAIGDLIAPVGVDFTGEINLEHLSLLVDLT